MTKRKTRSQAKADEVSPPPVKLPRNPSFLPVLISRPPLRISVYGRADDFLSSPPLSCQTRLPSTEAQVSSIASPPQARARAQFSPPSPSPSPVRISFLPSYGESSSSRIEKLTFKLPLSSVPTGCFQSPFRVEPTSCSSLPRRFLSLLVVQPRRGFNSTLSSRKLIAIGRSRRRPTRSAVLSRRRAPI